MYNRILVPLDGSERAEKVFPFVKTEAHFHGATIVLVRVIAPLRQSLMTSPSLIQEAYSQVDRIAKEYLQRVSEEMRSEGLEVETLIQRGPPAVQILTLAKEQDCNLIVIGTHGESGGGQWRLGSVANKIIKADLPIPLLVIPT
jgi:nucleotide-binding universal stress UspA family protein